MKYLNRKTGFIFHSDAECNGEDWEIIQSSPDTAPAKVPDAEPEEKKEEKPRRSKKGNAK